ncbi:MAG: hypothetical protein HC906_07885 [Bacteroidales bacterium]|nr:hypothetical protein [Bacteroidales bacterium]
MNKLYLIPLSIFIATACVPPTQFNETRNEQLKCSDERELLVKQNEKLTVENTEMKARLEGNDSERSKLLGDSEKDKEEIDRLKKSTVN